MTPRPNVSDRPSRPLRGWVARGVLACALIAPAVATADEPGYGPPVPPPPVVVPVVPPSGPFVGTGFSSDLTAVASVVAAQGEFNRQTAAALIDIERARALRRENAVEAVRAYHELRQMGDAARERDRVVARERTARHREFVAARGPVAAAPAMNPETGGLDWPPALRGPAFEAGRARIDALLAARRSPDADERLEAATDEMLARLKSEIGRTPPSDYAAAKRYLAALRTAGPANAASLSFVTTAADR